MSLDPKLLLLAAGEDIDETTLLALSGSTSNESILRTAIVKKLFDKLERMTKNELLKFIKRFVTLVVSKKPDIIDDVLPIVILALRGKGSSSSSTVALSPQHLEFASGTIGKESEIGIEVKPLTPTTQIPALSPAKTEEEVVAFGISYG